jgi:hypothetical protein
MQDVFYIEDVEQATALLKPIRIELLKRMGEPRTCPELGGELSESAQKIYYHIKALEQVGLVEKTGEARVRGVVEGYYQAKARSYWLSPALVGHVGGERTAQDQTALRFLLTLAEEMHGEVGHLGEKSALGTEVPALGLSAQIYLPDAARRAEFLQDVQAIFQQLATKYGMPPDINPNGLPQETDEAGFRLILACYPKAEDQDRPTTIGRDG